MSNILIATPTIVDQASTITSGNEEALFPVTNLQSMQPSQKWRTQSLVSIFTIVDIGSEKGFDFIALVGTNATDGATWRIRTANTVSALTSSPIYDSSTIVQWPEASLSSLSETPAIHYTSAIVSSAYVRIDITDASNSAGYFEAGRLFIAEGWRPTKNISYNWGLKWEDKSLQYETINGNTITTPRGKYRIVNFSLDFLDEDEMYSNAYVIDRLVGTSKDVFVVRDLDSASHLQKQSLQGVMTELPAIVNSNHNIFRKRYKLKELI